MKPEKANLEIFSETLISLAENDPDLLVVTSDSRGSARLNNFSLKFPEQIVEIGIAEQNMVGTSAGLASTGKKVFAVSPASFLTTRALEQIKNDVAYSDYPVKLVGISAGVSYGALGSTHHSLHDVAVLRAIYNMNIYIPADNFEAREAVLAAYQSEKPVFIKFGKKPMPLIPREDKSFKPGKASVICKGSDVGIIACGETVLPAYQAAMELKKEGISTEVLSMHTIKPIDEKAIKELAKKCKLVVTVEEHSIYGGLGEACASVILQSGISVKFKIIGISDEETVAGSQAEIFQHYDISQNGIKNIILKQIH